jgi:hydroxymethylbilane synthase
VTSLRLGTRGSQLALWQARAVATRLEAATGVSSDLVIIKTAGDRFADAPLSAAGGKRLFVKELEEALVSGQIDLAVHSAKDLPAELPAGLVLGATLPREDPRDALVLPAGALPAGGLEEILERLGPTPRIGTSSVRRVAQLRRLLPEASFLPVRGNLDTRLRKLDAGQVDALVLAAAGLVRLGLLHRLSFVFPVAACVPAPGQGIIAVEVRQDDEATRRRVAAITDPVTAAALAAERALVAALGGGCQLPLGAVALAREEAATEGPTLDLHALVISPDGRRLVRHHARAHLRDAEALGRQVAAELVRQGAQPILDEARAQGPQARSRGDLQSPQ